MDELNRLTGNFGSKALIGEGSYGRVFFATLSDGQQAAIKKLDTSSSPDPEDDFASQVSPSSIIKHERQCCPTQGSDLIVDLWRGFINEMKEKKKKMALSTSYFVLPLHESLHNFGVDFL